jgi:16S rRNA (uracil1498-N3)-methyltransferase
MDRIEWFLEKATESGIEEVTFLLCRHSERKEIKLDRLNRLVIAALKQSRKTYFPKINAMTGFVEFIESARSGEKLIFTTDTPVENNLNTMYHKGNPLNALIGPEGDFHESEINLAINKGFKKASLGSSRLRTETAGLNVCMIFNFINT